VKVVKVTPAAGQVAVEVDAEGQRESLTADQVLMAVGRGARPKNVGPAAMGVSTQRGLVTGGPTMETAVKGILAVGGEAGRAGAAGGAGAARQQSAGGGRGCGGEHRGPLPASRGLRHGAFLHFLRAAGGVDWHLRGSCQGGGRRGGRGRVPFHRQWQGGGARR